MCLSHILCFFNFSTEAGPAQTSPTPSIIRGMGKSKTELHPARGFDAALPNMLGSV